MLDDLKEAVAIANDLAPEHLEVNIADPSLILEDLVNYGSLFLGGNTGELQIVTERIGCGRLLVFKDSYFNCFLPFLLQQYEQIDVIDPRFYSGNLEELLSAGHYDRILYFYNLNTLRDDQNLSLLTE